MFTHIQKGYFIPVLRALLVALSLFSTASYGQGEKNGALLPIPSTIGSGSNQPSVEQTLVPESVFAMQLAEALKLGPIPDEAKAEELLSGLGIEPKNGWIAEYPVTPEVLGDVEKGISIASDQGKIALTKDQALKLFNEVKASLGFDVKPGPNSSATPIKKPGNTKVYMYTDNKGVTHFTDDDDSIPEENRKNMKIISQAALSGLSGVTGGGTTQAPGPQYTAKPKPEVINKQYYEQGPPVVTYYEPPDSYNYLYSWVPYPFWSTGLYFPGYFVLNDFRRHLFFNRKHYFVSHHVRNGAAFSHPRSVDQVDRNWQGELKPRGRDHSTGFSTSNAQADARAIVKVNPNPNSLRNGTVISRRDVSRKRNLSPGNSRTFGNVPVVPNDRVMRQNDIFRPIPYSGVRTLNPPSFNQRTHIPNAPRFYSPPAFSQDRALRSPRSFGGNVPGGLQNGGSFGRVQGGGNFRGHGGGGSSSGASRGGGHR